MNKKQALIFFILILGLPLVGAIVKHPSSNFFQAFYPDAVIIYSRNALPEQKISWLATIGWGIFAGALLAAFLLQLFRHRKSLKSIRHGPFPWWGWLSLGCVILFWAIAWSSLMKSPIIDNLTFPLLWGSYIVLANAITLFRTRRSLLTHYPRYLVRLFFFSIPFWWYFEYLNRFVFNWFYLAEPSFNSTAYLVFGSLAFSTILPGIISTREMLLSFSSMRLSFDHIYPLRFKNPRKASWIILFAASLGLAGIGVWPEYLYPLLWISPLLILVSLQELWRMEHIFSAAAKGYYALLISSTLAACVCGLLWEMWNFHSTPKWVYSVPWLGGLKIFEMPLIGYLGYLPFGLECLAVCEILSPPTELSHLDSNVNSGGS